MDLCDLAPTLVEQAGLPLSPFYQYLLAMKKSVPLQTAGNDYMDADGVTRRYGEDAENDQWMSGYFYLEYNNIGTGARRNDALFAPQAG